MLRPAHPPPTAIACGPVKAFSVSEVVRSSALAWRRDALFLTALAALLEAPVVVAELAIAHGTGALPGTEVGAAVSVPTATVFFVASLVHHFLSGVIETIE